MEDQHRPLCKKYIVAEILPNEAGNCSLCNSPLTEKGDCTYSDKPQTKIYIDEENDRQVEVFTTQGEGMESQYTGVEVTTLKTGEWRAEMGCWFVNSSLDDYDGVPNITVWVITALRGAGWTVPTDFDEQANYTFTKNG